MELWKVILLGLVVLICKSIGFLWAINTLFGLDVDYSVWSVMAGSIFIFCINPSLPGAGYRSSAKAQTDGISVKRVK